MVRFRHKHDIQEAVLVPETYIHPGTQEASLQVRTSHQCFDVVTINRGGRLVRVENIASYLGLDLDDKGRIKLEDE